MDLVNRSRHIGGTGPAAADWARDAALAAVQPVTLNDLIPPGARVVVVAPHPDDEILTCGALLHLVAARGDAPLIVAVTDGEASHPGSPIWPPERLRQARTDETNAALAHLGIDASRVRRLHIPDGGVTAAAPELERHLSAIIAPGDIVITTWRFDGHPDHEACGRACAAAAPACAALLVEMPVWTWHWAAPGDARVPWQRARRLLLPDDALRRKREAVGCFASQLGADTSTGQDAILAPHALQRLLHPCEVYFR